MAANQPPTVLKNKLAHDDIPPYVYRPLSSSQFRLLTILPDQCEKGDPIKVSLSIHELDAKQLRWEAISYHWGTSEFSNLILIDGCSAYVNESAHSALYHLRLPHHQRTIWLDQICINQDDEDERYRQVPLMGDIFRNAHLVVIYPRNIWPGGDLLFQLLNIIHHSLSMQSLTWWYGWRRLPERSPLRHVLTADTTLTSTSISQLEQLSDQVDDILESYDTLVSAPYFTRTWIVQEAGLSRKCIIQCSEYTATWESLIYLDRAIHQDAVKTHPYAAAVGARVLNSITLLRDWYIGRKPSLQSMSISVLNDPQVRTLHQGWKVIWSTLRRMQTSEQASLLSIIRHFRHQQSTDGRDKVFGFLGLAHTDQVSELLEVCASDTESKRDLCSISFASYCFAVWQLESTRTLDVLMGACYKGVAHKDLPYWVADWACRPADCDTEWVLPFRTLPHEAGIQYRAEPEVLTGSRALVVRGIIFDVVVEVVDAFVRLKQWQDPAHETWQRWKQFALKHADDQTGNPYGDEAGCFEAYWRTLIYDVDGTGKRASAEAFGAMFQRWSTGEEKFAEKGGITVQGRIVWKTHALFRTKKGYLGNGCADVRPGDLVCVLHGGRLPFILRYERDVEGMPMKSAVNGWDPKYRRLKGYYMIGGDAYTHGICEGQAWEMAQKEGIPTQEFVLI